jgi:hypothetical protein
MEMAGLPSDQVTALAVVRELGSLPNVLLAFAQAVAAPAIHSPSARRTIDREIILSPFIRSPDVSATLPRNDRPV